MPCNYYIKLPNGGEVKISAELAKLTTGDKVQVTKMSEIQKALGIFQKAEEASKESSKKALIGFIVKFAIML